MALGGLDGFLNVCRVMRTFDELKYAYLGTTGNYDEIVCDNPINIYKKNWTTVFVLLLRAVKMKQHSSD